MTWRTKSIDNTAAIIDSREIASRLDALEDEEDDDLDEEEREEREALRAVAAQLERWEWRDGLGLLREDYFDTYVAEMIADTTGVDVRKAEWPWRHLDLKAAAEDLRADYRAIDFRGVTYYAQE